MSESAVPHVIHSIRICELAFASSDGKVLSKTAGSIVRTAPRPRPPDAGWPLGAAPAAGGAAGTGGGPVVVAGAGAGFAPGHITNAPLNDPSHANLSRLLRAVYSASAPPIDSPAIARSSRCPLTL